MSTEPEKKPDPKKQKIAQQVNGARLHIVEQALLGFVESIDDRTPSDEEVIREGLHMQMAWTPLAIFEKDGWKFNAYFCWRRKHLVALGFLDERKPLDLKICRVPDGQWPPAVLAFVHHHYDPAAGTGLHGDDDHNAGEEWKKQ